MRERGKKIESSSSSILALTLTLTLFPYPERDLNPHNRNGHRILSPACLPFHHPGDLDIYNKNTNSAFSKQTDHRRGWWNVHPCSLAASLKTPTGCFLNACPYHPGDLDIYNKNTNSAFSKQTNHRRGWWNVHPCSLAASLKTPTGCFLNACPYHPGINCPAVLWSCSLASPEQLGKFRKISSLHKDWFSQSDFFKIRKLRFCISDNYIVHF